MWRLWFSSRWCYSASFGVTGTVCASGMAAGKHHSGEATRCISTGTVGSPLCDGVTSVTGHHRHGGGNVVSGGQSLRIRSTASFLLVVTGPALFWEASPCLHCFQRVLPGWVGLGKQPCTRGSAAPPATECALTSCAVWGEAGRFAFSGSAARLNPCPRRPRAPPGQRALE